MRITMFGNGSSGNHGCEAIARGTVEFLGRHLYTVLSENGGEDARYGLNTLANVVSAKTDRKRDFSFIKAYAKLKLTGNYTDMDGLYYDSSIRNCRGNTDIALSIGGDNYCYGDAAIYAYLNRAFQKQGIKTVLWGCSVEPAIAAEVAVSEDLRRYSLVAARESITYEAVRKAGAKALLMPDPAFYMKPAPVDLNSSLFNAGVIGINISPMIIANEKKLGVAYSNYKHLIHFILDNTDAGIALIPHVVWSTNDDRIPLGQLYEDFGRNPRLIFVGDHTAPELKYIISKCSFFIGARTHATIAAYSSCVPTLVVGYSVKARGIARDLFGTEDDYVVSVQQLTEKEELTQTFFRLYEQRAAVRAHLENVLPDYLSRGDVARKALEDIVST